jgi:hypothetical protein
VTQLPSVCTYTFVNGITVFAACSRTVASLHSYATAYCTVRRKSVLRTAIVASYVHRHKLGGAQLPSCCCAVQCCTVLLGKSKVLLGESTQETLAILLVANLASCGSASSVMWYRYCANSMIASTWSYKVDGGTYLHHSKVGYFAISTSVPCIVALSIHTVVMEQHQAHTSYAFTDQ